jgi:hypothetical protein
MKVSAVLLLLLAALVAFFTTRQNGVGETVSMETARAEITSHGGVPVIVELFTSEGCSSCPPADEVLSELDATQPVSGAQIIALGEHVDYWNHLGWNDPYSSNEFSKRQSAYADFFGRPSVYTPQMIVDGRHEFVGGNMSKAREVIAGAARSPKASIELLVADANPAGVKLSIQVRDLARVAAGDTADVLLAVTETGLRSEVSRGENAGRYLKHTAVVREISSLGQLGSGANSFEDQRPLTLDRNWNRNNLRAVVFVQERASRRVLGAAMIRLSGR